MDSRAARSIEDLLLNFSRAPDEAARAEIEREVWRRFGVRRAVLVLDLSGFSVLTQRHGVVHYLSMVRRMQLVSEPIVEQHAGTVVKFVADNLFATFPTPLDAVNAARALRSAFDAMNIFTADEQDIRVAIGIDEGTILVFEGPDAMGNAVNRAFKLGEDVAAAGEILITRDALEQIPEGHRPQGKSLSLSVSGIEIDVLSIRT
ncbi:MAG: adenylate/guanylate cyclase domain-containing protein [Phycisphaerales bacterium]